jgi:hypothetical protein
LFFICFFYNTNSALADIKLTFGNPKQAGLVDIEIKRRGITPITIQDIEIPEGATGVGKATIIENKITGDNKIPPEKVVLQDNMITIIGGERVKILRDSTGETTKLSTVNGQRPKRGGVKGESIQTSGILSGKDINNQQSVFTTSLGFITPSKNVSVRSRISFLELPTPRDHNSWLRAIFYSLQGKLPSEYQNNLHLTFYDENEIEEITFDFPEDTLADTGFMEHGTTDIFAISDIDLESVPVPEPITILGTGLVVGLMPILKKQLKTK